MQNKEESLLEGTNTSSPKVSLFVVTDGRIGCLEKTLDSFRQNVVGIFLQEFIVNDCVNPVFREQVDRISEVYGFDAPIHHAEKQGFSGAYHTAFNAVHKKADYCFILEDDFTFNEPIVLSDMIVMLRDNPHLCQVALKRQAWNKEERKAGGIVEQDPDNFHDKDGFCQHRKFFTTNPSLVPAWVIKRGWPLVEHSEGKFSLQLFEDPAIHSAYLGAKLDPPKVHHIGEVRAGHGY